MSHVRSPHQSCVPTSVLAIDVGVWMLEEEVDDIIKTPLRSVDQSRFSLEAFLVDIDV